MKKIIALVDGEHELAEESYGLLLRILHRVPFFAMVPNDDNRIKDVLFMRRDWNVEPAGPVSVLEVLVGIAERMRDIIGDEIAMNNTTGEYFWELIRNLGLEKWTDAELMADENGKDEVELKCRIWVGREYKKDGCGGIFPLRHPHTDQRRVELWYQMNAYILENFTVDDDV